jgi:hypothetical protein
MGLHYKWGVHLTLRHIRQHRMGRIAQYEQLAPRPASEQGAAHQGPFDRLLHHPNDLGEAVGTREQGDVA